LKLGISKKFKIRGKLFIEPGAKVYPGMIIGEHNRDNDLEVNPVKAKALTNFRAAGKEDAVRLSPSVSFSLEQLISYIQDDEVIEVTPTSLRCRKKELDSNKRKTQIKRKAFDFGDMEPLSKA
jgi:GTP-binding protein